MGGEGSCARRHEMQFGDLSDPGDRQDIGAGGGEQCMAKKKLTPKIDPKAI